MVIDEIECDFTQLQTDIANGPILPTETAEEIRTYLTARYDFRQALPLEGLIAHVEKMLRTWQVQVTHPRYFGLFNPSVTLASVISDTLVAMYNPQLANWRTSPQPTRWNGTHVPARFLAALHQRQIAWMSEARIGETPVVRACITSFRTTGTDIHWVVNEMNRLIE
jgi:hypothetical protein